MARINGESVSALADWASLWADLLHVMPWRDQHVAHRVDDRRERIDVGAIIDPGKASEAPPHSTGVGLGT